MRGNRSNFQIQTPAEEKNEPEIISTINFKLHQLPAVTIVNGKKQPKGTQNGGHQETVGPTLSGQLLIADADEVFFCEETKLAHIPVSQIVIDRLTSKNGFATLRTSSAAQNLFVGKRNATPHLRHWHFSLTARADPLTAVSH